MVSAYLYKKLPNCFLKLLYHFAFPHECIGVIITLYPYLHLALSFFFNFSHFSQVCSGTLVMVLVCIFLLMNDIEHLFMYFYAIHMPSLGKCLFKSF